MNKSLIALSLAVTIGLIGCSKGQDPKTTGQQLENTVTDASTATATAIDDATTTTEHIAQEAVATTEEKAQH